ncbi:hypothetical protein BC941DRAFT_445039 [Chlamydoabsidia padenii]|nr:hypothetical protein BC941DRAFT_445039 [Chlamydoabsidia padenii]
MLHLLPLELVYQVLSHVAYSDYAMLYHILPQSLVDNGLMLKLKYNTQEESLFKLVSTNWREFATASYTPRNSLNNLAPPLARQYQGSTERSNESSIPLFFKHMDVDRRLIWLAPDFRSTQYYFEVKAFYVSHGKLTLRSNRPRYKEKIVASLCDIRNQVVSICGLLPITMVSMKDNRTAMMTPTTGAPRRDGTVIVDGCCALRLDKNQDSTLTIPERLFPPRPPVPWNYSDQLPIGYPTPRFWPVVESPNCGYLVVEQVAISIHEFLDFVLV